MSKPAELTREWTGDGHLITVIDTEGRCERWLVEDVRVPFLREGRVRPKQVHAAAMIENDFYRWDSRTTRMERFRAALEIVGKHAKPIP